MKASYKKYIQEIISALMVLLFIYASISKIIDFQKFQIELGKSPILGPFYQFAGKGVLALEIIVALMFFSDKTKLLALYVSFGMMVLFTFYIIVIINFSDYIPCSCGGVLQNLTWSQHILFNLVFVVLSAIGVMTYPSKILSADKGGSRKPITE